MKHLMEKLVHLTPQTARVLRDGAEETIPAQQVQVGDRIRVLPGESLPVDKLTAIGAYQQPVCMIGDGVNDAPPWGTP